MTRLVHDTEDGCGGGEARAAVLPTHAAPRLRLHTVSLRVGDAPATAGDLATSRSVWKLRMRICHSLSEPAACWEAAESQSHSHSGRAASSRHGQHNRLRFGRAASALGP